MVFKMERKAKQGSKLGKIYYLNQQEKDPRRSPLRLGVYPGLMAI
jgi:hypothetical protein